MSEFLKKLGKVDRLEVELGNEVESFHVNLTKEVKDQLVGIGMKDLLLDRRCVKV
jgi:predicted nuclease with TOPRIM domain